MNKRNYIIAILFAMTGITNFACTSNNANNTTLIQEKDSLITEKGKLVVLYTKAINDFIKAAYKKQDVIFDTLYFAKRINTPHDNFPDIMLPSTINNTQIRLISTEEGDKLMQRDLSAVYINMVGWVYKQNARFVLNVFSKGYTHEADYTLDYSYNTTRNTYVLDEIKYEYYKKRSTQARYEIIYKDGKYVDDK